MQRRISSDDGTHPDAGPGRGDLHRFPLRQRKARRHCDNRLQNNPSLPFIIRFYSECVLFASGAAARKRIRGWP